MNIKLLNEHNLEFLSLKEDYTGSSESIHFKMPHCWKSLAVMINFLCSKFSLTYLVTAVSLSQAMRIHGIIAILCLSFKLIACL